MPVFDAKRLTEQGDGEVLLATILHATPRARDEARARGRMRAERATMLAERESAASGAGLAAVTPVVILPVT